MAVETCMLSASCSVRLPVSEVTEHRHSFAPQPFLRFGVVTESPPPLLKNIVDLHISHVNTSSPRFCFVLPAVSCLFIARGSCERVAFFKRPWVDTRFLEAGDHAVIFTTP